MEVLINIDKTNAVQLAEHLAGNITKDYKTYETIKEILHQLQSSEEFGVEQKERLSSTLNKFEEAQKRYFMWGNR